MDKFGEILKHAHSGWRWIVLVLLIAACVKAFVGIRKNKEFTAGDKKLSMFAMIAFHIQFTVGIVLYFFSPYVVFAKGVMKSDILRFYTVEHISMMVLAMVLITIGYSKSKKAEGSKKFNKIAIFYTAALLVVLAAIPWPFSIETGNWF